MLYSLKPVAALDLRLSGIAPGSVNWTVEDMGFAVATAGTAQGGTHAIIYSLLPQQTAEGRTVLATFDASLTPRLVRAVLSDPAANPVSVGETLPTGIINAEWFMANGECYDLQGIKVNSPQGKGIYIVNGKKVVIK